MDLALLIRSRLNELALEQKDLAAAAQVTESYISQLLARKKIPPAPERTDIYARMGRFLRLPGEELSKLAKMERLEETRKKLAQPPRPLFRQCRELLLDRCHPARRFEVGRIFEREPFGVLERMVTQKLLEVCKAIVEKEMSSESWICRLAEASGQSPEEVQAGVAGLLHADVFRISVESRVSFLGPLIRSWDISLKLFSLEFSPDSRFCSGGVRRFEFAEVKPDQPRLPQPGFVRFLEDRSLSGDSTAEELEFLEALPFKGRCPGPLYYYRELQNLRDPLHFPDGSQRPYSGL